MSLSFRTHGAKRSCLGFAIFNFGEKVQKIFKIGLKKIWSDRRKIPLGEKTFQKKKFADTVSFFICQKLATQPNLKADKQISFDLGNLSPWDN